MARVHPTALVEEGVSLGEGTAVWDHAHLRGPARVGRDCIIGEKTYVAYGVEIGDRVKVNAFVYLCTGVTLEDGVMVSAGTVFTNDRYPRATTPDLSALRPSDPDEDTTSTVVAAFSASPCSTSRSVASGRRLSSTSSTRTFSSGSMSS